MPPSPRPREYLLVEGNSDKRVIEALCKLHGLPTWEVQMPTQGGGIDQLLESLPERINEPGLARLGIVVDADVSLASRWHALRDRLQDREKMQDLVYSSVPPTPPSDGWLSTDPKLPRIGFWLMPDNTRPGMLEDFTTQLIPNGDALLTKAEAVLREIERDGLQRYSVAERPKARIHTWLAWQKTPGQPLGQALTSGALDGNAPLARAFVAWLRRLFDL